MTKLEAPPSQSRRRTMTDAPERIWLWRDEPHGNLVVSTPSELYPAGSPQYVRADLHQQALEAARAEGFAQAVEEAARLCETTTMDSVTNARNAQFAGVYVAGVYHRESGAKHHGMGYAEAIRALIDKPADQVAEAAILLADHIDRDMNAANRMIEAYTKVTMDTPVRHWLSQCLRAIAQKEVE